MNFITFVLTVLLFACVARAEDCASKFNVTAEDWKELKKDTAHPSEKILCMLKCEYENDGALNPDKTINAEKLVKKITSWKHLDEPIKAELKECVQKVKVPLNTCANMKPYFDCVRTAENEQNGEDCAAKFNVTADDWTELKKDTAHPSEKILCMLKCEYENDGALNPDKTINAEKLVKKITAWKHLDEPIKAELKECVQKVKVPLNTCANMKPYFDCVRTAENEQDNKVSKA
ncbi:uncharacterized protein LOC123689067 isoform X2 [Harmonia axyridis]|uniref:uncharacterized protein LOC123689067 isoform X2 n=1 Tax=Harmonia axyridis TaxID=115357 RepID=UPI001E278986|nr:uncharacterized protein LOC123689067 isoform X2 [Harmonia axyridis]